MIFSSLRSSVRVWRVWALTALLFLDQASSARAAAPQFHQSAALSTISGQVSESSSQILKDLKDFTPASITYPHFGTANGIMRRGGIDAARVWKLAIVAALLGSLTAVCIPGKKQTKLEVNEETLQSYPWKMLPPPADVAAAGPTFADGVGARWKKILVSRGMRLQHRGMALLADQSGQKTRALIVRNIQAGPKSALAVQLHRHGLQDLAPLTVRKTSELGKLLHGSKRRMMTHVATGPWVLKHALARGDAEGVTPFKDAQSLLAFWESMPKSTRCSYVAQACLQHPFTLNGGPVMVRSFVLALDNGRWFLHTESLILVQLPELHSPDSPVLEEIPAVQGSAWSHHAEVWQNLRRSLATVAQHKSLGRKWLRAQTPVGNHGKAGCLSFQLFVVECAVDQDKRPWLTDMYPMSESPQQGTAAESVWEEVMKDAGNLILNPLLEQLQRLGKQKVTALDSGGGYETRKSSATSAFVQLCEPDS